MAATPIPFIDLAAQRARLEPRLSAAVAEVVASGAYILGPPVRNFEAALSAHCGARHSISCANGSDAITLSLMALGFKRGEAVICPSFTFAATAEMVALLGGVPIFADIDPVTFNLDPSGLPRALEAARQQGLAVAGVISVDLFGQPADYDGIERFCAEHRLWLICDAAQAYGATWRGRKVGTIGRLTTTSFYPAKPLGAYGDGGAIFANDDGLNAVLRSIAVHGQGADRYDHPRIGINSRLDSIQAAVLLEKLSIFDDEIAARQRVADRYAAGLGNACVTPVLATGATSTWAQYTVRVPGAARAGIMAALKEAGVPTVIYYPIPLHRQQAYRHFPVAAGGLPQTERAAAEVMSLPMHPYLEAAAQDRVIDALRSACRGTAVAA
jgi:dTDP-4-amino-4,6-dideoxygalactose transaminase